MFSVCSLTVTAKRASAAMASSREIQFHAFGVEQRDVLFDQRVLGLGEDAHEIGLGERREFDANRQAPLKFRDQVGRLGDVERACGDKKNVVGANHAVARIDRGAFDDRQDIALHAFAGNIRARGRTRGRRSCRSHR